MLGVVILAGGNATRLPNKLERPLQGEPMIVRVFHNVRDAGAAYVLANRTFPQPIDDALTCPVIVDRSPGNGPLAALADALPYVREREIFVVSGDLPFVHAGVAKELTAARQANDEAVVACDANGVLQPLCAWYDRLALIAAANASIRAGERSMKAALERMRVRTIRLHDDFVLKGVNTPEEWVAVRTIDLGLRTRT